MREVAAIREALEMLQMKKACLFDMDGLIFDTERTFMEQLSIVMEEYGYHLTREIYCGTLGTTGDELRQRMEKYYGEAYPLREIGGKAREKVNRIAQTVGLAVKPEIPQVLASLQEKGISCAVASSSRSDMVEKYLEIAGLRKYFQVVVGGEQVSRSKPAPDIFILAAQKLGIAPEDCVVLEDSENGVRAGKAAGCATVCVPDLQAPREEFFRDINYMVRRKVL